MSGQMSRSGTQSNNVLTLSPKQQQAVSHIYEHDATLLIAPTGVGKTIITLTALDELINDGVIKRCIVVAPAKVSRGWVDDAIKWSVPMSVLAGTGKQKIDMMVGERPRVYVTSYESLPYLLKQDHGADAIVYDEVTRLKSSGGKTFKTLRGKLKQFKWRLGLSATPLSESWEAVYGMCLMLDGGERFGRNNEVFMRTYFNQIDYKGHQFEVKPEMLDAIANKLASLTYVVEESEKRKDLLEPEYLPPLTVALSDEVMEMQGEIARNALIEMDGQGDVVAVNAAVVSGKLRQLSQGFVIDEIERTHLIDDSRVKFFVDTLLQKLKQGPVVGTYEYSFIGNKVYAELMNRGVYGDMINGSTSKDSFEEIKSRWSSGKGELLLLQVKAGSHGLDGLQMSAAQMLHYAPIWSRDATQQLTGRLDRTGQTKQVTVQTLVAQNTIDEAIVERVEAKGSVFREFLKRLAKK